MNATAPTARTAPAAESATVYRVHHKGRPLVGDGEAYAIGGDPADNRFTDLDEAIRVAEALDGIGWDMDVVAWDAGIRRVVWG